MTFRGSATTMSFTCVSVCLSVCSLSVYLSTRSSKHSNGTFYVTIFLITYIICGCLCSLGTSLHLYEPQQRRRMALRETGIRPLRLQAILLEVTLCFPI